jgi:protein-S-isoprenylcysteine O-methyltransferase Ste14
MNALARGVAAATVVGLAGHWSGSVVVILALVSGLTFFDLGRRDRAERAERADRPRAPFGGAMQLAFLAILCAAAWDNRSRSAWVVPGVMDALGLAVIVGGACLRRSAAQALGRHFTVTLSLLVGHQLVSTGPYRWLRHPNYAGLALIALGTTIALRSPMAAAVALGVWLPIMLLRIRDEERALRDGLGASYVDYSRHSWRLVPGIY